MMRSLYSGISGLQNHQTRMDVVGNNIGNVNTTGFKSSSVSFQDILSQTVQGASGATGNLGGTNPVQVGLGVGLASINTNFTDGSLQSTGKATDLAISGSGFFVLSDGTNQLYTRGGSFSYDTSGNLVVPGTGYKVMGYMADSTGTISANAALQTIQIPTSTTMAAKATTKVTYADNLNASASAIGSASLITSTAANLVTAQAAVDAAAAVVANAEALGPSTADTNAATAISEKTPTDVANAATLATATLAYSEATAAQSAATTAKNDASAVKTAVDTMTSSLLPADASAAQAKAAIAVSSATAAVTAATPSTLASATQAEKDAKATKALIDAIVTAGTVTMTTATAAQTSAATAKITAATASTTADTAATVALNAKTAATTAKTASEAAITAALNTAVTADTATETATYNAAVIALATATTADTAANAALTAATTASTANAAIDGPLLATLATAYTTLSASPTAKASVDAKAALAYDPTNATFIANDAAATSALIAGDAALITTYNVTYATLSATAKALNDDTAAAASTLATKNAAATAKTNAATALATAQSDATTMVNTLAASYIGAATAANDLSAAQAAVKAANDKSSDKTTALSVYDTQGNKYNLSGTFEKTGSNTWSFTPDSTIKNSSGVVIANVTTSNSKPISIVFNADGSFKQSTAAATITIDQTGLTPSSPYVGAGAFTVTPDFSTMTQYGTATTASATDQDGYTSGSLTSKNVNSSGVIVGTFDNGKTKDLGQVVLANFNNPSGLVKSGDSLYVQSNNSGIAQVGTANTAGRGGLTGGSLEMSNVDLAAEFSNMIVTQRGFQANSKIITTADTMLEELVNLKR